MHFRWGNGYNSSLQLHLLEQGVVWVVLVRFVWSIQTCIGANPVVVGQKVTTVPVKLDCKGSPKQASMAEIDVLKTFQH